MHPSPAAERARAHSFGGLCALLHSGGNTPRAMGEFSPYAIVPIVYFVGGWEFGIPGASRRAPRMGARIELGFPDLESAA